MAITIKSAAEHARGAVATLRGRASLFTGTDVDGTTQRVSDGATLSPENFWLLGCSAILASIGLDVSSAAVIIGAMLISPLMGPILGVGLGLGTTDRGLLQRSLRDLGLSTVLTILVSATYFLLSPLSSPTAELLARTRPTLLDVGVAFFGGVAGIVAGSRKNQSMALPGVAIATALMPPLCTAGFGLATRNWSFLFGGFYLYALNAIFIALATLLVVRLLRFPYHVFVSDLARRRERRLVAAVALMATLPSIYFLHGTVKELRENKRVAEFIHREVEGPGRVAPQWERRHTTDGDVLAVFVAGRPIPPELADSLSERMAGYNIHGVRLELVQSGVSATELKQYQSGVEREILRATSTAIDAREATDAARARADSTLLATVAQELVIAFPEVARVTYAPHLNLAAHDSTAAAPAVFLAFAPRTRVATKRQVLERAQTLVRSRLGVADLVVQER